MSKSVSEQAYSKKLEEMLGEWKSYGAVSTPQKVVEQMIDLTGFRKWENLDILEPACGFCNFLTGIYLKFPQNNFYGIEINDKVYQRITALYKDSPFCLVKDDFLLWQTPKKFDLVIGNPPYGIIGDETHYPIHVLKKKKEQYKRIFHTWYGKYNIYGAFIEKSIDLLKPQGKLVFIVPATWMVLDEFRQLRNFLASSGGVKVYYLGNNIFEGVSVSVCILVFQEGGKGAELYCRDSDKLRRSLRLESWNGDILKFENKFTKNLEQKKTQLGEIFEIKISARSTEVKNFAGVLVKANNGALPFMNGRNIKKGKIERKGYVNLWLMEKEVAKLKSFYSVLPRIVVGHTKGGKVFAAMEKKPYPYVGDVYHLLPKPTLNSDELKAITDWLNSKTIEKYMVTLYREITPHTTATQLKRVPIDVKVNRGMLFD